MNDVSISFRYSLAVLVLLSALSCELNPASDQSDKSEQTAAVTIRFRDAGAKNPRTIMPASSTLVAAYELSASGPEGAMLNFESRDPWVNATLSPGVWDLAVRGVNENGAVLLVGVGVVEVQPGVAASVEISLSPRSGLGSCRILPIVPVMPAGSILEIDLRGMDGTAPIPGTERSVAAPFAAVLYPSVASGYVLCSARLKDEQGTTVAGIVEAVRILPDTETAFSLDFASIPGSVSFALLGGATDPLDPEPPCWSALPLDRPVAAELDFVSADASVAWFIDGAPVELDEGALPAAEPAGSASGFRRIDVVARSSSGTAAGSRSRLVEFMPGVADGAWSWAATFQPSDPAAADLPGPHGFIDLAASADGRILAALDAPIPGSTASGNAAASAVFRFTATEHGSLFLERVSPVRSGGSLRSCDRLVLSSDGARYAAFSVDSSWIAVESTETASAPSGAAASFVHIDAASLGAGSAFRLKDAVFVEDGGCLLVLTGPAPYRVVAIEVGPIPTLRWSFAVDEPALSSLTFGSLAMAEDESLLLLSRTGDAAALLRAASGVGFAQKPVLDGFLKRSAGGPAWLDGPLDAEAVADGFRVLCADSGQLGSLRATEGVLEADESAPDAVPSGSGASRLALSPNGAATALCASSASPAAAVSLDVGRPGAAIFPPSSRGDTPAHPAACVWLGQRLFVSDAAERRLTCFVRSE